jgi:hypothetical protein
MVESQDIFEGETMRLKAFPGLLIVTLLAVSVYPAIARHEGVTNLHPLASVQSDSISGMWNASFFVNGRAMPATFEFKLDGAKVTGTAFSEHTGAGTIRDGSWSDGELSFTLDFKKHESIAVTGTLKDAKLTGEFTTEGFSSNWEAKKK